jgi:hypothetical protein
MERRHGVTRRLLSQRASFDELLKRIMFSYVYQGAYVRQNCEEAGPVTNSIRLSAVFLGLLLLASSCATVSYSGDVAERINWREYNDC